MNNEEKKGTEVQEQQGLDTTAIESNASQKDIFADIFGQSEKETFVAKDVTPQNTSMNEPLAVQETPDSTDENANTYQYWQSQADKKSTEVEVLKSQMSELISKVTSPESQPVKEETVKIEKPVKPNKPANFSHSEALDDPESDSAKYVDSREQYMDGMVDYTSSVETERLQMMQAQQAEQQKTQRDQTVISDLQRDYNYTPKQANDFMTKMTSPDSLSLDNLVRLHQMDMNVGSQEIQQVSPQAREKQALMQSRQEKLSIPTPIGVQPGASTQSSKTVEDQLMDSMVTTYKKKNPF
jgi:hypothetical protein